MTGVVVPRVLVIDDDPDTVALLADALRKRGFETVAFESAPECLAWLEDRTADVVVTDVQMPYMTGLQLTAGLRQAYPTMPVVIVTGVAEKHVEADARMLGAFEVLRKPVRVDTLATTIVRALEQRSAVPSRTSGNPACDDGGA